MTGHTAGRTLVERLVDELPPGRRDERLVDELPPGRRDERLVDELPPGRRDERLVDELPPGRRDEPLAGELSAWLAGSHRFHAFATANREKVRKQLRTAGDAGALRDVRAELRVAPACSWPTGAWRSRSRRTAPAGSGRTSRSCWPASDRSNVEVTRPRRLPGPTVEGPILGKLRQLPPGAPNVLLVASEGETVAALDVAVTARALRARADAKDEAFFVGRGLDGTRAFYERFLRLSAVLTWCEAASGDDRAALWANPSARIALPARAARAVLACLRSDGP